MKSIFKNKPIDIHLEKQKALHLNQQEEIQLKNDSIMKHVIDIIITITKDGSSCID